MTKKNYLNILIILLISISLVRGKCDSDKVISPPSDGTERPEPVEEKVCKITTDTDTRRGVVTCEKNTTNCQGEWVVGCRPSNGILIPKAQKDQIFVKALNQDERRSNEDGKSWTTAFSDLQKGIKYAFENNKKMVYVAQGTYKPTSYPNGGSGDDRYKHFSLRNGIEVIGGFPGEKLDEPNNPEQYETILSGDIGTKDDRDNVYHVFYHPDGTNLNNSAKLAGVTITQGYAYFASPDVNEPRKLGGGMYNFKSSPTLTTVTFRNNTARDGGGMYNFKSSPTLTGVAFTENTAITGGGMRNYKDSSPTLKDVTFTKNEATVNGGGMHNWDNSSPKLTDVTFTKNKATINGGGGMYNYYYSSPKLTGVTFNSNTASRYGGGMFNFVGCSPEFISNVVFNKNIVGSVGSDLISYGGAIYNSKTSAITGTPTYGTGDDENKKVVKNTDGTYSFVKSNSWPW